MLGSVATAQVTGFVESVGFNNQYRPDCWTPLVVNLTSTVSDPMEYQLQIWQEDLDKDRVLYTKDITLSPKVQEKYQMYFLPRSSDGLPSGFSSMADLQKALQVRICIRPAEGKRPEDAKVVVERLPVRIFLDNVDPAGDRRRGKRMVLVVSDPDSNSKPVWSEYDKAFGLTDDIVHVNVRPADLGENVLYYASIDAVIWLNAQADELDRSGAKRREALDEYVREGGKLVVCQPPERQKIEALDSLLPVETKDAAGNWLITFDEKPRLDDLTTVPKPDAAHPIDALPELARPKLPDSKLVQTWNKIPGPFKIARARPRDGAVVDYWENWKPGDKSPFIVRKAHGLGCVTWVAQDLGDPNLTGFQSSNWPYIWDRVVGWHNDTRVVGDYDKDKNPYDGGNDGVVDFSASMLQGTDYTSKGATYIFLAILFFVVYWVAAGPGTYFVLAGKKRKELNWFAFGAWAFVGTALTVLVVRLLLRGDAEVRHLTVLRSTPGEPAVVYSRVGLYIPRDGEQTVALKDAAKEDISYITPLEIHPAYVPSTDFPAAQVYSIPVHDDPQPVSIKVPFRSTLKKLEARWVGDLQTGIGGSARLVPAAPKNGYINGILTNQTGGGLKNVYIVFNHTGGGGKNIDWALFIPRWDKDKGLDLSKEFDSAKGIFSQGNWSTPGSGGNVKGTIQSVSQAAGGSWDQYWATTWGHTNYTGDDDRGKADFTTDYPRAFPILSLYDRLNPGRNIYSSGQTPIADRVDFIRRGGRMLDMSPSVAAGRLVVLGQSDDDKRGLPFPLMVEGSRVEGEGRIYYQFALPVDRSEMEKGAEKAE